MKILLTGATGFLGKYLVRYLAPQVETLYVLVREKSFKSAQRLFESEKNVICVKGDICLPDLFSDERDRKELQEKVDSIVHAAAYYDLQGTYADTYLKNVVGTQNTLYFASLCSQLKFFHCVSTIAVAGDFKGVFTEDTLEAGQQFYNHYSKTKYDAEILVRNWISKDVQVKIYRPGIIVGESQTGEMERTDGPYYFFKFLKEVKKKHPLALGLMKMLPLPFDPKAQIPLVPVDWVAELMSRGILENKVVESLSCYHLFAQDCPNAKEFIQDTFASFGIRSLAVPLPSNQLNPLLMDKIKLPRELLTYMYSQCVYDQRYFEKDLLSKKTLTYGHFKKSFFEFASRKMRYS